jgi:hypothetical protein
MKRISDLESSVLYLESRNSELASQFEESRRIGEKLNERLELVGMVICLFIKHICYCYLFRIKIKIGRL